MLVELAADGAHVSSAAATDGVQWYDRDGYLTSTAPAIHISRHAAR